MSFKLTPNQTALITGSGMGIGRATVLRCLGDGIRVMAVDVLADKLDELNQEANRLGAQDRLVVRSADIGQAGTCEQIVSEFTDHFGAPDFVMNNAASRTGRGFDVPLDEWRHVMDVNFWAIAEMCHALLPIMAGNSGAIVNVGSKQGITNPPGHPAYNITKSALKTYSEALAHELRNRKGVQPSVHLLVPGWTTTGEAQHRHGAWLPDQVVDAMFEGVAEGDFYIICPDDETTADMDKKRIIWAAEDITENRPPLSRWHDDWKEKAAKACS